MSEEKETMNVVEESVDKAVDTNNVSDKSTKRTWWNRIVSAIIGAVMAVAAMFGITAEEISTQKENVKEVKDYAAMALDLVKQGKFNEAKDALELAIDSGKEVVDTTKEVVDKVKETPAEDIASEAVKGIKETL